MNLLLALAVLFGTSRLNASAEISLQEVPYGSQKFCIYSDEKRDPGFVVTRTCSVLKDESCPDLETCEKDKTVKSKFAKISDEKDIKWNRGDGATCLYPPRPVSMHRSDGVFICSSVVRCGRDGKWLNYERVSCMGNPDPDTDGGAICPGFTACKSPKLVLPRPPAKGAIVSGVVPTPTNHTSGGK